jgi:hypothetical protein
MLPSDTRGDLVVRLLSGESDQHELVLKSGCASPPIALGTHGAWAIRGRQVAKAHVMLAWSGETLFVGAPGGEGALLDGFPLGARWTEVRAPSELRFGNARLSIGRRAGPDEETEVPPEEATQHTCGSAGAQPAVRRVWTDDQVTCMDDGRILEALRLTRDDEVTCIAEVDLPSEAKRPAPVVRRRSDPPRIVRRTTPTPLSAVHVAPASGSMTHLHALPALPALPALAASARSGTDLGEGELAVMESSGPSSRMPSTIPSEGLIAVPMRVVERPPPVDVARPSQPTMAIPEPQGPLAPSGEHTFAPAPSRMDSIGAGALAVSGEHTSSARATATATATESTVVRRNKVSALRAGWTEASLPKKAIALLMIPALAGALLMSRSAPAARAVAPASADRTSAVAAAPPSATVTPTPTPTPTVSTAVVAPGGPVKAGAPALRDARTAERRALDTAASGQEAAAAEQYDALAAAHPETVAFREAARILRGRVANRHD